MKKSFVKSMGNNRKLIKRECRALRLSIRSVALSFCVLLGTFSGNGAITVKASENIATYYPADDLPAVPVPEMHNEVIVCDDAIVPRVRNASNYNTDVETGEHYQFLSDEKSKCLYRAMVKASDHVLPYGERSTSAYIAASTPIVLNEKSPFTYEFEQFEDAYEAVRYDYPDRVQLTLCGFSFSASETRYNATNEIRYSTYIIMQSKLSGYDQERFSQMNDELKKKRDAILSDPQIAGARGNLEKELAIHDKLIQINTYDKACANLNSAYHVGHTAYGALVLGSSVCDGYSMAFEYLLAKEGLSSMVMTGTIDDGGGHAWNIVKQGGDWYEVDTTWDDYNSTESLPEEFVEAMRHNYYHLTTEKLRNYTYEVIAGGKVSRGSNKHIRDGFSLSCPIATGTKYNYANVKAAIAAGEDFTTVLPEKIEISPKKVTGAVGSTGNFSISVTPANASVDISYKSSNEAVIIVDESGKYTVKGPGYAVVTAFSHDGNLTATAEATILDEGGNIPTTDIQLSPAVISAKIGDSGIITCKVTPDNATNKKFSCVVDNENVVSASITADGNISYVVKWYGRANINVKSADGQSEGSCVIDVPKVYHKVSFNLNGGTGTADDKNVLYYGSYGDLPSDITRDGYDFLGWYTAVDGGSKVTAQTKCTIHNDHTLYAHWQVHEEVTPEPEPEPEPAPEPEPETPGGNDDEPTTPGGNDNDPTTPGGNDNDPSNPGGNDNDSSNPGGNDNGQTNPGSNDNDSSNPSGNDNGQTTPGSNENAAATTVTIPVESPISREYTENGVNYELDPDSKTAAVAGVTTKKIKSLRVKAVISAGGRVYKVTSIKKNAFNGCKKLKKIVISANNLKSVGKKSFKGIKKGAKVTISCKNKTIYDKISKKLVNAGAKNASFKYVRG